MVPRDPPEGFDDLWSCPDCGYWCGSMGSMVVERKVDA